MPTTAYIAQGCRVQWKMDVAMAVWMAAGVRPSTVPGGGEM